MLTIALKEKPAFDYCHVEEAQNGIDYFCPECAQPLRKREGQKQAHFYHYQGSVCRWSKVGLPHLKTQQELAIRFDGLIEKNFRSIGRIADVFCPRHALIIEVQYSPIAIEEIIQRTWDYRSIGLEILWILQKNHPIQSEFGPSGALFHLPHYFCDMNKDSFELLDILDDEELPLNSPQIRQPLYSNNQPLKNFAAARHHAHTLWQRSKLWSISLTGDLLDSF